MTDLPPHVIEKLYRTIKLIQRFEQVTAEIYPSDKIKSPVHLALGHEHVAAAVCAHLTNTDLATGYYRSHALYLAKGGDPAKLMAEMYGKETGCCKGKGGSMHVADMSVGLLGTSAVVGTGIPNAVGAAMTLKQNSPGSIAVAFFGDGASEEGAFYESLNFAAVRKLPVLFICENNGLAIHTSFEKRRSPKAPPDNIARALGVSGGYIGGALASPTRIYKTAATIIEKIRTGNGPAFLEVEVVRQAEHVGPGTDWHVGYRDEPPQRDVCKELVLQLGDVRCAEICAQVETQVLAAVQYAEDGAFPDKSALLENVYA